MNAEEILLSNQAEEYLEAIYRLEQKGGFARTMELARNLKVVAGSVTNTIENLERKGLVIHKPYKGVKLTENGRKIASSVLRRHRLAERLLTDILHLDWSEVHDPACKLEHALSPEILKPLENALGHPKRCPHGNPIPPNCGGVFEKEIVALSELGAKMSGVIIKITEEKVETNSLEIAHSYYILVLYSYSITTARTYPSLSTYAFLLHSSKAYPRVYDLIFIVFLYYFIFTYSITHNITK